LYGGVTCGAPVPGDNCPIVYLSDTWTWDGTTWTQRNPATTPGNRQLGLFAFDSGSQTSILFGGIEPDPSGKSPWIAVNDTWSWDGTTWTQQSPATSPGVLFSATMASYPPGGTVVIFGGLQDSPGRFVSDTWTLEVPIQLVSVVSRKVHGSAGTFDINLPVVGPHGLECRSGGANGDYTIIFTFANPVASVSGASVTSGTGTINSSDIDSNDAHQYIVNLTGVTNAQVVTVSLTNVNDAAGNSANAVSASMAVLISDTTADRSVNSGDISQTKSQSGNAVTNLNFREDLNADGTINSADIALTKSKSGTALP
jgi:hypothetical protein